MRPMPWSRRPGLRFIAGDRAIWSPVGYGFLGVARRRLDIRCDMSQVQMHSRSRRMTRTRGWTAGFVVAFPIVTNGKLQKLCRTGQVRVDGKRADGCHTGFRWTDRSSAAARKIWSSGRRSEIPPDHRSRCGGTAAAGVLFKDDWVIVIDKPFGLAVQGGTGTTRHLDGMLNALAYRRRPAQACPSAGPRHFGRAAWRAQCIAARRLGETFRGKAARKYYWGITVGVPDEKRGRIDGALLKKRRCREASGSSWMRMTANPPYRYFPSSITPPNKAAWVALWPLTGRTHQLRAHMALIGKPILGDGKYGGAAALDMRATGSGKELHLHARRLILPTSVRQGHDRRHRAACRPHMKRNLALFRF